jgi:hypothetical protein
MARLRRPRLWQIALSIPLACALGGWIASAVWNNVAHTRLLAEIDALRALGVPTEASELDVAIDPSDNAATIYLKAIGVSKTIKRSDPPTLRPDSQGRLTSAELAAYRSWVDANEVVLRLLAEASERPSCSYGRNWELGPDLAMPEIAEMKGFTKLAVGRAHFAALDGDLGQSIRWLIVGLRLSEHIREPSMIGQLASMSAEGYVQREFQHLLSTYGDNDMFRERATSLVVPRPPPPIVNGIEGEVVSQRIAYESIIAGKQRSEAYPGDQVGSGPWVPTWVVYALKLPAVRDSAETTIMRHLRVALATLKSEGATMKEKLDALSRFDDDLGSDESFPGRIANMFSPMLSGTANALRRTMTLRRLSECGLHLWQSKAETGSFPDSLDPTMPWCIDPFSDKPLVYRREKDRFVLYSVGPNGKDDGGKNYFLAYTGKPSDDVEFRAPRP